MPAATVPDDGDATAVPCFELHHIARYAVERSLRAITIRDEAA
jgi:hypothetical protein